MRIIMNATEFCYWLQGFFELTNNSNIIFNIPMVRCLRNHLALVKEIEPNHNNAFIIWLEVELDDKMTVMSDDVKRIKTILGQQFKHVIDPTYLLNNDLVQADKLQTIHDWPTEPDLGPKNNYGYGNKPGTPTYRC